MGVSGRFLARRALIYLEPYLEYLYKDTYFISKWAAADAASRDGVDPLFLFSSLQAQIARKESFFGDLDTTVEPKETWEQLLKERAQQLRDELPVVNIGFSGGADSYTMLNAFVSNGIHVDKIYMSMSPIQPNPLLNYEQQNYGIPMLKEFDLKGTQIIIEGFNDINEWIPHVTQEKLYWEEGFEILPNMNTTSQRIISSHYLNDEPIIRGTTEPRVYFCPNTLMWRGDMWDSDNWRNAHAAPNNIPFLSDPLFPKLHLKQLHLTVRELKRMQREDLTFFSDPGAYKRAYHRATRYDIPKHYDLTTTPYFVTSDKDDNLNPFKVELYKKKRDFFKALYKYDKTLVEKIFYTVTSKIGGIELHKHMHGCRIFDIPLAA